MGFKLNLDLFYAHLRRTYRSFVKMPIMFIIQIEDKIKKLAAVAKEPIKY